MVSITIRNGGDDLKYIIPQRPDYAFRDLLKDSCEFFDKGDAKDYIFMDEQNNIFPLHPPAREFLIKSKLNYIKQFIFFILNFNKNIYINFKK